MPNINVLKLPDAGFIARAIATRRVLMAAAWVKPRLEEGPWCENVIERIA